MQLHSSQTENDMQLLKDMEHKLQAANDTIMRLQTTINEQSVQQQLPSVETMIEHNDSVIVKDDTTVDDSNNKGHSKNNKTLCEILYTSELGDEIYREPIKESNSKNAMIEIREIQCRTENWTDSWKNAINSLTDASISMQGYLCKMTASKWNSRGTLDKIQRRWFVLRGNYMTYYKTNLHTQPKSDKCVNLLNYKVNPIKHEKSPYAFELISTPKENIHKKQKNVSKHLERTKFILIPDLDCNIEKQKEIRDKWVKSLRLATKGAFLWDVLLNIPIQSSSNNNIHSTSQTSLYHSYRGRQAKHNNSNQNNNNNNDNNNTKFTYNSQSHHSTVKSGPVNTFGYSASPKHSNSPKNTYNKRQYSGYKGSGRRIGGNTQDYPDYPSNQY